MLSSKRSLFLVSSASRYRNLLALNSKINRNNWLIIQNRSFISMVGVLRSVLKIRYIILGSAVGGGIHVNNKYNEFKDKLPSFDWIKDLIPDPDKQSILRNSLINLKEKISEAKILDSLALNAEETIKQFRELLQEKRNKARLIIAIEILFLSENGLDQARNSIDSSLKSTVVAEIKNPFSKETPPKQSSNDVEEKERIEKLQQELINIQNKYQREIERLENENRILRKSLLLKSNDSQASEKLKKVNKTLIDLYSDVLDELNEFDSNYNTQDHLPRVVVVGDQSAGKTSVLEMTAQARIFPRGAGEMMTRSPVKVTLKEGPYHIARFKNNDREFDLTKETELSDLRSEIETRMKSKIKNGQTVSKDVISLTVEGPGIPRMVLIDLPGVISTVTNEMASDTKQSIEEITKYYMGNPNAIILCVQDGSIDAERSIVTDLVSQVDPQGKRTIFVMTKIDQAEQNLSDPQRLKKILEGRLFPMKALGYFAVVTGRGGKDDSIDSIKDYEESFFKNSKLCKQGILNASQCTTQNLSFAVSDCFWKMVKSSVEQQADLYKARKFNLETEWKNTFSKYRELDRDELFEIGKNQILDQIIKENLFFNNLNESFKNEIFERIYLPCAVRADTENFNVLVDINLKSWIDNYLPKKTVEVGWQVLSEQFWNILIDKKTSQSNSQLKELENDEFLYRNLKIAVAETILKNHHWDPKAVDVLKLLQMNSCEDRIISHKEKWKESAKYWQNLIMDRMIATDNKLKDLIGPDWMDRWINWSQRTPEQKINVNIKNELEKIINTNTNQNNIKTNLEPEDIVLIKKNLKTQRIDATDENINLVWERMYTQYFLRNLLARAKECEKQYALHIYGGVESDISCDDVVFFYRIRHILQASSKALRQQTTNTEIQRLNRELKMTLDDFNQDLQIKSTLLTGKRVNLAEELKKVRRIQEKLEEFIAALNKEK
ncbi:dynamin-like protein 120 kDa protein, mitochondrial-like protein [Sarcoptes scabiei]|uniref:Dynamin-like GTPase OPA1, mitochondrial n=1 Tax=Sarcoptes scabiei TaxID=52283 RepID=A0A132AB13_SARSC|nr:dynamin-like protein 120 kDa protein, mitochondrial-like protein [Sarcoptes scabiei]